jgi:methylase of polypeptide subunit release factors
MHVERHPKLAPGAQEMEFGPVTIGWDEAVLRPRPWTLAQSRWAAELASSLPPGPVLELCCGAGQIGLAAAVWSDRTLVQVDADPRACVWASRNAERAGVVADVRCADLRGDWFGGGELRQFPLVIADPPYLPSTEVGRYPDDPELAIDGGTTGLEVLKPCVEVALAHAAPEGAVLVQVLGLRQALEIEDLLDEMGPFGGRIEEVRVHDQERAVLLIRL